MTVVGRDLELSAVDAFLDGGAPALAILGAPGIGKTTVWREAVERAGARGAKVLVARPAESEARLSFAALADLTSTVPHELFARLPAPQRRGLDVALLRADSSARPAPRVVATAFLTLLRALTDDASVVIAIDDLQWLDPPSAAVVEFALRRLRAQDVRVIFSMRDNVPGPVKLVETLDEVPLERLEIGPLSVAALHRILSAAVGHPFARPILVRIAETSARNPFHALEIARELARRGVQDGVAPLPVPDSLGELVRTRVSGLPARTRAALLRAAAVARPTTQLVGGDDLAAAEEDGLVWIGPSGRIHFTHPLFASAVYSAAATARRMATHRELAAVVVDPVERAYHLALGCDGPSSAVVGELEVAARHARGRAAPDTAASLLELALRLAPADEEERQRLRLELAEHLYLASDFSRARALLVELLGALDPGERRSRALLTLAEIDYWHKGESAAVALAEEALLGAPEPLQRARCLAQVGMYAGTVDVQKAAGAARAAEELLAGREADEPALAATVLSARLRAELFLGHGFDREAAERAHALESSAPSLPIAVDGRVVFKLGQWLRYVDDLEGARARLSEAEQQAHDEGDEASLGNILLNQLIVETWIGDWERAATLTERMCEAFEQQGVESEGIGPWRAYLHAHAGRLAETRATLGPPPTEPVVAAIYNRCLGLAELAAGEFVAADRHLWQAVEGFGRVDFREPAIWRVEGDAIEAAVGCGALDRAETLVQRFEEHAARSHIPWNRAVAARSSALLDAARGDLEGAARALDRALVAHEACPMPYEHARTLLVRAHVSRRLKRKREARSALDDAGAIFARLGADGWTARVAAEQQRLVFRRAPIELTPSELQIAQLAADGMSNPEIGAHVFVSRKTVEATLARVYRKLGISSRGQLDRALHRDANVSS